MRAFVAGATGYTGQHVLRELRARGIETHAHLRPGSSRAAALKALCEETGALPVELPFEEAPLRDHLAAHPPDIVFALIGTTRRQAAREGLEGAIYERIDFGLTDILRAATEASGARPLFVYLSAMGVHAGSRSPYMRARWRAEEALRTSPLRSLVARPGFISGPDRDEGRPLERAAAWSTDAALSLVGALGASSLRDRWAPISGAELGRALVHLATASAGVDGGDAHQVVELAALHEAARAAPAPA